MENIDLRVLNKKDCIETTFKDMQIRSEKRIAEHILIENVYDNNLICDISNVDYTKNNKGKTNLKSIEGNNVFVDDLFVYGYLSKDDVVFNKNGKISCTTGKDGAAVFIIEQVRSIVNYTIAKNCVFPTHINFMTTIKIKNNEDDKREKITLKTVKDIEKHINVKEYWETANNKKEAYGLFVLKIDVSNIAFKHLQDNLKLFQNKLICCGFSIFSVDYTKDFSGTLNKKELINYLLSYGGFRMENTKDNIDQDDCGYGDFTILRNSNSAGNNTLTYINEDKHGKYKYTYRIKLYNKPVCNFEKSDVRSTIGGHISNYANSNSERSKSLFSNKEAQERGVTRIEISVYGYNEEISKDIGESLIEEVFNIFYIDENEEPLLYISPIKQQWENLIENIDKGFTLVDKINKTIYVIYYGSTLTNTLVGIIIDYSKSKIDNNLENFIKWAISDFCFKMVPIYRLDILGLDSGKILLSNISCYAKGKDSYTILTPCKKPLQVFKDPPNLDFFFHKNNIVDWCWRDKKERQPNFRKPNQELIELPELAKNKKVSLISTNQRKDIIGNLLDLKRQTEFLHSSKDIIDKINEKYLIPNNKELKIIRKELEIIENYNKLKQEAINITKNSLKNNHTFSLSEILPKNYKIVGWKEFLNKNEITKVIVVLEDLDENLKEENKYFNIWANTRIIDYIIKIKNFFTNSNNPFFGKSIIETKESKKEFYFSFIPEIKNKFFSIDVLPPKNFYNENGKKIIYNPIKFKQDYAFKDLKKELEKLEKEHEEAINKYNNTILKNVPLPLEEEKYWCRDLEEGLYKVERITDTFYGKKPLIYLHVIPLNGKTCIEKIVKGHFIELEWRKLIEKLNGEYPKHPIICRLGICKTEAKSKRKFRTCILEYEEK